FYLELNTIDYEVSVQQLNDLLTDENGDFFMPSKHFNEVYPGILLENEPVATNVTQGQSDMHADTGIIYHGIPAVDTDRFDLSVYFEEASNFIDRTVAMQGKVHVHCQKGYGRPALCQLNDRLEGEGRLCVDDT
uniref:Uncharacterized protein n=2 Tax=Cyprinus carpio TaxID=7962 RepID=A0A8C1B5Y8_CYPCA